MLVALAPPINGLLFSAFTALVSAFSPAVFSPLFSPALPFVSGLLVLAPAGLAALGLFLFACALAVAPLIGVAPLELAPGRTVLVLMPPVAPILLRCLLAACAPATVPATALPALPATLPAPNANEPTFLTPLTAPFATLLAPYATPANAPSCLPTPPPSPMPRTFDNMVVPLIHAMPTNIVKNNLIQSLVNVPLI